MGGWSFETLDNAPAHRVDDIILMMQADAAAGGGDTKQQKEQAYLARTNARGTR